MWAREAEMTSRWAEVLRRIDEYRWEIPADYKRGMLPRFPT